VLFTAGREAPVATRHPQLQHRGAGAVSVVNVSRDTTARTRPRWPSIRRTEQHDRRNNDWNYNDGCGVNATFDGGRTWTPTLPSGFIPGITAFTNDHRCRHRRLRLCGDPAVAFSPDGGTAYFTCSDIEESRSRSG